MKAEMRFVLDCCAPRRGIAPPCVPSHLDWDVVITAARRHQVLPLVAARVEQLETAGFQSPPPQALRTLRTSALAHRLRCQHLVARWRELRGAFAAAMIPVITLKGPLLAELAYDHPLVRVFADLDLLVSRAHVARAADLLKELGYAAENYAEAAFASGFFHAVETNFHRIDDGTRVDLHWRLSPQSYGFGPDGEGVWERAACHELTEGAALGLSSEDSLIYLTVHAARHGWPALSAAADIAFFLEAQQPDWDSIFRIAAATRARRMLAVGLMLSYELSGAAIPKARIDQLRRDTPDRRIAQRIAAQLTDVRDGGSGATARNSLCLIEDPKDRLRYVALSWAAPTLIDWRFLPLPRLLYPAYYPLRQLRIALGLIRRIAASRKLFRRDR